MAKFEIIMPKMGESIIEATITKWLKSAGETIAEDEPIAEIATDKVDSEIPSPVEGTISEILYKEGDVVPVGKIIAVITLAGESTSETQQKEIKTPESAVTGTVTIQNVLEEQGLGNTATGKSLTPGTTADDYTPSGRFYSPLVRNIARQEKITDRELDTITGTGKDGRVTKKNILDYIRKRPVDGIIAAGMAPSPAVSTAPGTQATYGTPKVIAESGDEIFEMDRMRKLIADHMVMSKHVSPHVTSFINVDVTHIVRWREKIKDTFQTREKEKLTYTPIFIEAAALGIKEFPRVNASVDGTNIIHRKKINIGMATALPNGNLIVPVIKDADQQSLLGLIKRVNDLASRARNNNLLPDEIQGGTFTVTNFGTFDSLTGTPIINQPQVAILGIGAIRKQPAVIETPDGDMIGIRNIMILSLAYDHRVVDGALAGMYLKRLKELLERFDVNRSI
jgi:2-oxoglutarate dehydrogenase E2 component (dihydrolipoamide succinyltransferase)